MQRKAEPCFASFHYQLGNFFQVQLAVLEKSLDFTRLKSVALNLFSKQPNEAHSNNGILDFLLDGATPDVREQCRDSRKEVDRKLKVVCEAFIDGATRLVVGPIRDFLSQVTELPALVGL